MDSVEYRIPERWCGRAQDSSLIADPALLVRLPENLTYEDYRIYVRPATRDAFISMATAARKDSVYLIADSGYRSARFQRSIIRRRLADGLPIEKILKSVAPPGYSEHETGLALDLVPSEAVFARTEAYRWLKVHAAEFSFFESIPFDSSGEVSWESWHWIHRPDDRR